MIELLVAIVGSMMLGIFYVQRKLRKDAERSALELLAQADTKAKMVLESAKLDAKAILLEADKEAHRLQAQVLSERDAITAKEAQLDLGKSKLQQKHLELERREKKLLQDEQAERARCALSPEEARQEVYEQALKGIEKECQLLYQHRRHEVETRIENHARTLIVQTLARLPHRALGDATTCTLLLPSDEIKAKIIGREGKNIKAFQQLTGVQVVIDDTPDTLLLSSFDRERRFIAKMALEALIRDGRISAGRIEEEVQAAKKRLGDLLLQYGKEAQSACHIQGVHPELLRHLGRLSLQASFGQNLLEHSIEVAKIMGLMAAELKLDTSKAIRMGLLHDIGKAVKADTPLSHAKTGYRLCLEYGESEEVANGVGCHHDEMPGSSLEAQLVKCADYLSGARRGARVESSDTFFQRLRDFETVALGHDGVKSAFAVEAGRELQVFVRPELVDDAGALLLAKQIAKKIGPLAGNHRVQISVIRETKMIDYSS